MRLDSALIALWVAASLLLLAWLVRAQRALSRISHSARKTEIDGHDVLVTDNIGPAVVGIAARRATQSCGGEVRDAKERKTEDRKTEGRKTEDRTGRRVLAPRFVLPIPGGPMP